MIPSALCSCKYIIAARNFCLNASVVPEANRSFLPSESMNLIGLFAA